MTPRDAAANIDAVRNARAAHRNATISAAELLDQVEAQLKQTILDMGRRGSIIAQLAEAFEKCETTKIAYTQALEIKSPQKTPTRVEPLKMRRLAPREEQERELEEREQKWKERGQKQEEQKRERERKQEEQKQERHLRWDLWRRHREDQKQKRERKQEEQKREREEQKRGREHDSPSNVGRARSCRGWKLKNHPPRCPARRRREAIRRRVLQEHRILIQIRIQWKDAPTPADKGHRWSETTTGPRRCTACGGLESWPIGRYWCRQSWLKRKRTRGCRPEVSLQLTAKIASSSESQPHTFRFPSALPYFDFGFSMRRHPTNEEERDRAGIRFMYRPQIDDGINRGIVR